MEQRFAASLVLVLRVLKMRDCLPKLVTWIRHRVDIRSGLVRHADECRTRLPKLCAESLRVTVEAEPPRVVDHLLIVRQVLRQVTRCIQGSFGRCVALRIVRDSNSDLPDRF